MSIEEEGPKAGEIKIGTSGWSYKEWEKVFYPDAKTPKLTFYSSIYVTAEIDSTFYANPSSGLVNGWARNTPKNFEFSVKLPSSITHDKGLDLRKGAEVDLIEFLDLLNPLHEAKKLGPLLIQLPPSFSAAKKGILEEFLEALPRKKDYKFAVEFRNKTWLKDKNVVREILRKFNVANTIVDEPLLPVDLTPTADFAFIRWHGRGMRPWYNYEYQEPELEPWIDRVKKEIAPKHKAVYGYFNNHFHGYAVENSLQFLEKIGLASQKQKETLKQVEEFMLTGKRSKSIEYPAMKAKKKEARALPHEQSTLGDF